MFRRPGRLVTVALISVAVVAVVVAALPKQPPLKPIVRQSIAPGDIWPDAFVVHKGDRAIGVGQLVARDDEPTRLCTGLDGILQSTSAQYRCSLVSVEVRGVDVRSMTGAHPLAGAVIVNLAVVHGTWNGRFLAIDQIGGNALKLPVAPRLDCEYEVPGAASEGTPGQDAEAAGQDAEAAYDRLRSQVYAGPGTYAGTWRAEDGRRVVVATTEDLVATGAVLRQVFELPLCLVRVRFSTAELTGVQESLLSPDLLWWPELAEDRNRVLAWVPVLDDVTVQALAARPAVEPRPLLMLER